MPYISVLYHYIKYIFSLFYHHLCYSYFIIRVIQTKKSLWFSVFCFYQSNTLFNCFGINFIHAVILVATHFIFLPLPISLKVILSSVLFKQIYNFHFLFLVVIPRFTQSIFLKLHYVNTIIFGVTLWNILFLFWLTCLDHYYWNASSNNLNRYIDNFISMISNTK